MYNEFGSASISVKDRTKQKVSTPCGNVSQCIVFTVCFVSNILNTERGEM